MAGERRHRPYAAKSKAGHRERVGRGPQQRPQYRGNNRLRVFHERSEQAPVSISVGAQRCRRALDRSCNGGCLTSVQGMCEGDLGRLSARRPQVRHGERTAKRRAADARSSRRRARSPAASVPRSDSPRQRSGLPQIPPRPARRGPGSGRPPDRLAPTDDRPRRVDSSLPLPPPRSQLDYGALRGEGHVEVPSRSRRPASSSSAASVRSGRWWKRATALAPARRPSSTAYSAAACPKRPSDASSSRVSSCASWTSRSVPLASSRAAGWYSPQPLWPRAQGGGTMVGHVGERRASVANPIAEGPPTLVGNLPGEHC